MEVNEKNIPIEYNCASCKKILEDSSRNVEGVYYARFDIEKGNLLLKVNPEQWDQQHLYNFLERYSFIQTGNKKDTLLTYPFCCTNEELKVIEKRIEEAEKKAKQDSLKAAEQEDSLSSSINQIGSVEVINDTLETVLNH
ncbi:hypothetical protein GCM10023331_01870 [Algivirga pacifica]|uniref:HMA domain-containing protein n=2 Tax=Algivirga pacifica TaxID=1162670 RepID=A0ABP9D229_9BACT